MAVFAKIQKEMLNFAKRYGKMSMRKSLYFLRAFYGNYQDKRERHPF